MKYLRMALVMFLVVACAQWGNSSSPQEALELAKGPHEEIPKVLEQKFQRYQLQTLLTYQSLLEFDLSLEDSDIPLRENPHYASLWVSKTELESLYTDISTTRQLMWEAFQSPATEKELKDQLPKWLLASFPDPKTPFEQIAYRRFHLEGVAFTKMLLLEHGTQPNRKDLASLYEQFSERFPPLSTIAPVSASWRTSVLEASAAVKNNPEWILLKRDHEHLRFKVKHKLQKIKPGDETDSWTVATVPDVKLQASAKGRTPADVGLFWQVDALDWIEQPQQDVLARALKQIKMFSLKSGVVLLHTNGIQSAIHQALAKDGRKVCVKSGATGECE